MERTSHIWFAIALALVVAGLGGYVVLENPSEHERLDPLFSREVVAYEILPAGEGAEAVVAYEYKGEKLPEKLTPNEEVSKRTGTSYTELIATEHAGTSNEKRVYRGTFYAQETFVREGNDWYYIEHATTTETAFNATRREHLLAFLFWRTTYAATASPFSGVGDGYVTREDVNPLSSCNVADGTSADFTFTTASVIARNRATLDICEVARAFLPFTTSSIPLNATITAATMSIFATSKANNDNDGSDLLDLMQTTQASSAQLVVADYNNIGAPTGATSLDITSVTTSAYNVFTLNATGLTWIKKSGQTANCGVTTGVTCLGIQENHVTDGFTGLADSVGGNQVLFSTSENTGTTQDPFMTITYSTGDFAFWQFQDF